MRTIYLYSQPNTKSLESQTHENPNDCINNLVDGKSVRLLDFLSYFCTNSTFVATVFKGVEKVGRRGHERDLER